MDQIVTALTKASLTDPEAHDRLNRLFDGLLAEGELAEHRRLTDLYWTALDETRTELAEGKPERQPRLPCQRTPRPKRKRDKTARERGVPNKKTNYAEKILCKGD